MKITDDCKERLAQALQEIRAEAPEMEADFKVFLNVAAEAFRRAPSAYRDQTLFEGSMATIVPFLTYPNQYSCKTQWSALFLINWIPNGEAEYWLCWIARRTVHTS